MWRNNVIVVNNNLWRIGSIDVATNNVVEQQ